MKKNFYCPLFMLLILVFAVNSFVSAQIGADSKVCKIDNTQQFLTNMQGASQKSVEFYLSGISDKASVKDFVAKASASERVVRVKVGKARRDGSRLTKVEFEPNACMNDFRLMLMAASVSTIVTPAKTFDVQHFPVKKDDPFE
jgi:hypothetical protein